MSKISVGPTQALCWVTEIYCNKSLIKYLKHLNFIKTFESEMKRITHHIVANGAIQTLSHER